MEEKTQGRPLRTTANKLKDIYNTYLRNEEGRTIPISSSEAEKAKSQKSENEVLLELENENIEENNNEEIDPTAIADLVEKFEKTIIEREELKEQVKRIAAELENFRRRSLKEKQELIDYANERLLFKFLAIPDDISNAVQAGEKSNDYDALLSGIKLIKDKVFKLFEEAGVKQIESSIGKNFDVDFHDALGVIPSDMPEGHIVHEVLSGYMINEKVLRHAKVITSAGNPEIPEQQENSDSNE